MKKSYADIVLSYGLFLGWLLSFPYNGPVLKYLVAAHDFSVASFSMIYTVAPSIFLIVYAFFTVKEEHAGSIMRWSGVACFVCTIILFAAAPAYWYPVLAVMGIASVLFIIAWSYYYTMEVPIDRKLRVMALVIVTGNVVYYLLKIIHTHVSSGLLLVLALVPLAGSLWVSARVKVQNKIDVKLEGKPLPAKLIFVLCFFLFALNLTDGMAFHTIKASFEEIFIGYPTFYGVIPYIVTLLIVFYYSGKLSLMLPLYFGVSFVGLAYLSFGLLAGNWYNYFLTETLLQMGWALLDLVLWTLFGLIASIYGRPLKICGYAFLANLFAVFVGGLLGVVFQHSREGYFLFSASFAVAIVFVSFLIVPWLNAALEKDLRQNLIENAPLGALSPGNQALYVSLRHQEALSPRERQVAELLIQGYTNKQIAEMLHITENTIKTHTRKIYRKLGITNKRELLQQSITSADSGQGHHLL